MKETFIRQYTVGFGAGASGATCNTASATSETGVIIITPLTLV
jgi:hypothetical protein